MGLDMYLQGRSYLYRNWENPSKNLMRDGYRVCEVMLELGYWRKHPNLHGYIVETFAGGIDECQEIPLNAESLIQIIAAIKEKQLPHTEGFFFGASDGSEDVETIAIFEAALRWLEGKPVINPLQKPKPLGDSGLVMTEVDLAAVKDMVAVGESRSIFYRASW
jgi:hypothetical protein